MGCFVPLPGTTFIFGRTSTLEEEVEEEENEEEEELLPSSEDACGARACTATAETARFGLTTHPWVTYHLSLLQVHCHTIAHPCQSNGRSTKQTKFCCFRGPHASMCHTGVRLCTQLRTFRHLCGFDKDKADRVPTGMTQRPLASIWASKKTTCPFRNSHSGPNRPVHRNKVGSLVIATKSKNWPVKGMACPVARASLVVPKARAP